MISRQRLGFGKEITTRIASSNGTPPLHLAAEVTWMQSGSWSKLGFPRISLRMTVSQPCITQRKDRIYQAPYVMAGYTETTPCYQLIENFRVVTLQFTNLPRDIKKG